MSDMLRHSSNGGAGQHSRGRTELYAALIFSYLDRLRVTANMKI